MKFYVYILESQFDGTFYIGQTNNLIKRIQKHNKGLVRSTKPKRPYKLSYFEEYDTRADSMNREWEIKRKYNTDKRKKLISSFDKTKIIDFSGL